MTITSELESIIKHLQQQESNLQTLQNLLSEELTAIGQRDSDKLFEIADSKANLLDKIKKLDQTLESLNLKEKSDTHLEIKSAIDNVFALLETCKTNNQTNHHAATQNQASISKVRDILLGARNTLTYDQKGQSQSSGQLGRGLKA